MGHGRGSGKIPGEEGHSWNREESAGDLDEASAGRSLDLDRYQELLYS